VCCVGCPLFGASPSSLLPSPSSPDLLPLLLLFSALLPPLPRPSFSLPPLLNPTRALPSPSSEFYRVPVVPIFLPSCIHLSAALRTHLPMLFESLVLHLSAPHRPSPSLFGVSLLPLVSRSKTHPHLRVHLHACVQIDVPTLHSSLLQGHMGGGISFNLFLFCLICQTCLRFQLSNLFSPPPHPFNCQT
jgi:hypothetical protein